MPGLSTTKAVTASPHSVSGSPSTATSPTAGCAAITSSTSFGMMLDDAGADDLLQPADDGEIAVAVERADVAGVQPAVAQRLARRLLVLPVAGHDVAALHQHFAGRVRRVARHPRAARDRRETAGRPIPSAGARSVAGKLLRRQVAADRRLGHAVEHADARPDADRARARTPPTECASRPHRWLPASACGRRARRCSIQRTSCVGTSEVRVAPLSSIIAGEAIRHRSGRPARPSRRRTDATSGSPARSARAAARSGTRRRSRCRSPGWCSPPPS